ncbi:MAG: chloride channel protein [Labilithrix sp.]|nr:chloride channel protein [Labilithrix sp.]MCW5816147.1 chloride channel protein [Labilithrix sp.]
MRPGPLAPFTQALRSAELRAIGRVVLHALAVGLAVGAVACVFFTVLGVAERVILEGIGGYEPLRPAGEHVLDFPMPRRPFSPLVLALIPAFGGLASGFVAQRLAHETSGGGGDAYIDAFHRRGGAMRKRVALVKMVATALTLGSGGSGGREGPTMQVGAAIGALLGRFIQVSVRERRILAVSGTAAGLSAIFGTPLGAALFATEVLYRDDFESDALVPAILASVTAHSVFVAIFPEAALFAHAPRYPFQPLHLPLYALLAIVISGVARVFVFTLKRAKHLFHLLRVPSWTRPGIGGAMLGAVAVTWIVLVNPHLDLEGRGIGILGSGYGAAQSAITGGAWIPGGWWGVGLLCLLVVVKILATSLSLGSGGSAGDFGPSLAIGGLVGGAFGRAAQLLVSPAIDPGAFALVGMGTFYGGIAHTPVSSLVMVCEMAGTYDLLPSLMLTSGLAFVLLRRVSLYSKQPRSRFESPAHAGEDSLDVLKRLKVSEVFRRDALVTLKTRQPLASLVAAISEAPEWQDCFPVLDDAGALRGVVSGEILRAASKDDSPGALIIAADVMLPPLHVSPNDDLHTALERFFGNELHELPVVEEGAVVGVLDQAHITRAYHDYLGKLAGDGERVSVVDLPP